MPKGKSKTSGRNGSQSNNHGRASPSDQRHDEKRMQERKSLKAGTETSGKRKASEGGSKR